MEIKTTKEFLTPKIISDQVPAIMKQKINSNIYCDEDFKKSFNANCKPQRMKLEYIPIVYMEATILDFNYDYKKDHSAVTGYHGTISSSGDVKLFEDSESWTTIEHAEERGIMLNSDTVSKYIEHALVKDQYEKIKSIECTTLKESHIVGDNCSINNDAVDILFNTCSNEIRLAAEQKIKGYLNANHTRVLSKTLQYNLEYSNKKIIFCPVYTYQFQSSTYRINAITCEPIGEWQFRKNQRFQQECEQWELKDKKRSKVLLPFVIFSMIAVLAEIIASNILLFKSFLNPENAAHYTPIAGTWAAIVIGLIAYVIFGIGSTIAALFTATDRVAVSAFSKQVQSTNNQTDDEPNKAIHKKTVDTFGLIFFALVVAGINFGIVYGFMLP